VILAINSLKETNDQMKATTTSNLANLEAKLVSTLEQLVVPETIRDTERNDLTHTLTALSEEGPLVAWQQKILKTLAFESMKQRKDIIKEAHARTLNWIFDDRASRFMDWLSRKNGIYWIKGKVVALSE
jgi:hypothetical protein